MPTSPHELLDRIWRGPPTLMGWLGAVNHKSIGIRYVVTGFGFFLLAGLDATVIRLQLAGPEQEIVSAGVFSQLFTMHGAAMMFFFAVPVVEAFAIYLVPLMIGTRDMAFPRLNAFGYWLYLFGGLLLYSSTLPDVVNFLWPVGELLPNVVPDGGWFAYPPLTGPEYSPGPNLDFFLIAVTMAEISAIVAAIELIVTILKQRAPGMSLMRMPLFVWSALAMSFAILFAFPAVIVASTFLEIERTLGLPFYDPTRGGDPLLWQHLFWIFGHPEVYIMFIPATGIVSMVLAAFAGRSIVGYALVVVAILATVILSFGLWVHHMFAVGLPWLGLAYFGAASMIIAIPSGIQVFAWLATMLKAPRLRINTAMLFVIGFLITFVLGGVTGVMVASVPFDLQVHDTYFVVAHFHYVIVGGVVLPIFAGVWYWFPKLTGRLLSETGGRWFFWLFFIGLNLAFLPQHQLGLLGMRRRVATFESDRWLDLFNLVSSAGQALMIAGVAVAGLAIVRALRAPRRADADPWHGGTLEWAVGSPPPAYNFGVIPEVGAREPLWEAPDAPARVVDVPAPPTGHGVPPLQIARRETLGTGVLDALPETAIVLPGNTLLTLASALALAGGLAAIIFRLYLLALPAIVIGIGLIVAWLWQAPDDGPEPPWNTLGRSLPTHATGTRSTVWWGVVLGTVLVATIYADVLFAHLYLAYTSVGWPPPGAGPADWPLGVLALLVLWGTALGAVVASRALRDGSATRARLGLLVTAGAAAGYLLVAGWNHLAGGPMPTESAYGAAYWALAATQLLLVAGGLVAMAVPLARVLLGDDLRRRAAIDGSVTWWAFVCVAGVASFVVLHIAPELIP